MPLKEVKDSCNCIWPHCDHHQSKECPNDAVGVDCGHCDKVHWLGDKSLGNGFRLCGNCASSIMNFMGDELPHLMQELSAFVPETLRCLESVIKDHYLSYLHMERSDELIDEKHQRGWLQPIRDSRALLEFAGLIINKNKKIPVEVLEESVVIAKKHKDLIEAFADCDAFSYMEEKK